jgi:low temperature requirement protein LtrA
MTTLMRPLQLRYVAGANPARRVTWLELFFDLVFVAAVAQVGEPLRHDYSAAGVFRFSVLFVLIWWAWIGSSVFATRFDTDDGLQRALTFVQMFAVAAMAANATEALDSRSSAGFAAAYALVRFVLVAQYARARRVQGARALATRYLTGHGFAAALWLISALVPAPLRFVIWIVAFAIDLGTPWLAVGHNVEAPPDGAHLPERFGLFTIILLGESVVAVMHGMKSQEDWSLPAATAAVLGMAMAFAIWWWYFDGTKAAADRHIRSRRDAIRFHVWSYAHLPLYLGIAVAAAGVERVVHTGAAATLHTTDAVVLGSALGAVMLAMTVIGASGPHGRRGHAVPSHLAVAAMALACAWAASLVPAFLFVMVLTTLCVAQLGIAMSLESGSRA